MYIISHIFFTQSECIQMVFGLLDSLLSGVVPPNPTFRGQSQRLLHVCRHGSGDVIRHQHHHDPCCTHIHCPLQVRHMMPVQWFVYNCACIYTLYLYTICKCRVALKGSLPNTVDQKNCHCWTYFVGG